MNVNKPSPIKNIEDTPKNTVNGTALLNNTTSFSNSGKVLHEVPSTLNTEQIVKAMNPRNNDLCSESFQVYLPEELKNRVEILTKKIKTSNSRFGYIAVLNMVSILESEFI